MGKKAELVAVTGAGGFIGSHLVEELLHGGRRVRALVRYNGRGTAGHLEEVRAHLSAADHDRLEIVLGDVTDARCMRELVRGCHRVFHLAALIGIPYSYRAPQSYVQTNIEGTLNVLEACREEKVPLLLHTSTSEVYGTAQKTPMSEEHPLQAQSPYAATKIAADKLVESYTRSFGLPAVTVRPFNTYGPRQSQRAVLPTIIAQALSHECGEIRLGSLDPVRDLTYVSDTVRAFVQLADADPAKVSGNVYNLGTGEGVSIGDLAQLVLQVLDVEKPIVPEQQRQRPAASEVLQLISDHRKVREAVDWQPQVPLASGIGNTADWILEHLHDMHPESYAQ